MTYIDSDLKNHFNPRQTGFQKWIDALKKQIYADGWPKDRSPWSKKKLQKEPLPTTIDL